ncbi:hypothetical protein D3C71_1237990 [compost metagenome]
MAPFCELEGTIGYSMERRSSVHRVGVHFPGRNLREHREQRGCWTEAKLFVGDRRVAKDLPLVSFFDWLNLGDTIDEKKHL